MAVIAKAYTTTIVANQLARASNVRRALDDIYDEFNGSINSANIDSTFLAGLESPAASAVTVADTASNFSSTEVEGALAELNDVLVKEVVQDYRTVGRVGLPANNFSAGAYMSASVATDISATTASFYAWKFDNTASVNLNATTGECATLTEGGSISQATTHIGDAGAFCSFDGVSDYLYVANTTFDTKDESFTVGTWIKVDSSVNKTNYFATKFSNAAAADRSFNFGTRSASGLFLQVFYNGADANETISIQDENLRDDQYHFVCGKYDQANKRMSLYLDGVRVADKSSSNLSTRNNSAGSYLVFGAIDSSGSVPLLGSIGEAFYSKEALTDTQIFSLYQKACPNYQQQQQAGYQITTTEPGTDTSSVLALYLFASATAGGSILSVSDETGNYDLTINGTGIRNTLGIMPTYNCAEFYTTATYLTHADLLDTMPSAVAFDFWMKPADGQPGSQQFLFTKYNDNSAATNDIFQGILQSAGSLKFSVLTNGSASTAVSVSSFNDGPSDWRYVVMSQDKVNGIRVWVDGVLESHVHTATGLPGNGTNSDFCIGALSNAGAVSGHFQGKIANFRIRTKILTQRDVDLGYASKLSAPSHASTDDDYEIRARVKEQGSLFVSQLDWGGLEVHRNSASIYRYGSVLGASDMLRLISKK